MVRGRLVTGEVCEESGHSLGPLVPKGFVEQWWWNWQGQLGSHIPTRLKFYLQNSFLEDIRLVLSCGLLHWESWHRGHQEELLGFDRTPRSRLYFRFLSLLHLSLEWTLWVKSFIIFKTAVCVSLSLMENLYSCCCFLPKPHQVPSPPQPPLWFLPPALFSLVWQSLVFRRQWVTYLCLLSLSLMTWSSFFPPFCQTLKGPSYQGCGVGGCGKLIGQFHFLWGGPLQPFFFFQFLSDGLKSAGLSWMRYQSPRFPDATLRPWQGVNWTKTGASLPLWVFPIVFTVSQDKFMFTNNSNCSSLVPCFGISFSTPSPSHLSNHLGFCDYFALTSGGWTLWT